MQHRQKQQQQTNKQKRTWLFLAIGEQVSETRSGELG